MSSLGDDGPRVKVGDVLASKYKVERILGSGGMGVVVAAEHVALHHKVALKLMLPAAAAEPDAVQRFLREARAAAQLRSEHVARVLDVGTLVEGEPFMVMELLEGSDLEELHRARGQLPVAEAVDYVRQACDAVAEAHDRGIVHRDLKPGNLFLATDARGRTLIKVLDFGISKHTSVTGDLALTKTATVMGSPFYMSPEQMRATRNVDARTDVWSLGVTLHQLIAGRVPFFTESPMELGAKVLHEEPEALDHARADVSPALAAVVRRCLEKDPARRFASARELSVALESALLAPLPLHTSTKVHVTRVTGADASALPFSHTAIAHSRTAESGRRAPRRSVLFALFAVVAFGAVALALRPREMLEEGRSASAPDVQVASPVASEPRAAPALAVETQAPRMVDAQIAQPSPPPKVRGGPRRPGKTIDAGAPPPPPSASAPSNPLDHL